MKLPLCLCLAALSTTLTSCATTATSPVPGRDAVYLVHIEAGGAAMEPGGRVTIRAALAYDLVSADLARIRMIIEDDRSRPIDLNRQVGRQVSRGHGEIELSNDFTVPQTRQIRVFFPLFIGRERTQVVALSEYPVGHCASSSLPAASTGAPVTR